MSQSNEKIILEAETIPQVELHFMNKTHHEEVTMVKELGDIVVSYQQEALATTAKKLSKALNTWFNHTVAHFSRENELMQKTGFPAYAIHSQEHDAALQRVQQILTSWESKQDIDSIAHFIFDFWPNWFNQHVNSMDMMTAKFAIMNGYSE